MKIYRLVPILLVSVIVSCAWDAPENKYQHENRVSWKCKNDSGCEIYAITKDKIKIIILKDYPQEPKILWHGNRLAEIRLSCGSPCYNSIFFDLRTDQVSNPIEFVLATDMQRDIVAKADISEIKVMKIFDTQKYLSIKEDFSPAAALVSVIEEARFTSKGDLFLRYSSGKDYDTKEATIKIDDKTFPILRENMLPNMQ